MTEFNLFKQILHMFNFLNYLLFLILHIILTFDVLYYRTMQISDLDYKKERSISANLIQVGIPRKKESYSLE